MRYWRIPVVLLLMVCLGAMVAAANQIPKTDALLIADAVHAFYAGYSQKDVQVRVVKDGWAYGTIASREDYLRLPSYFIAQKMKRGWTVKEADKYCWDIQTLRGWHMPRAILQAAKADSRMPADLKSIRRDIARAEGVPSSRLESGAVSVDVAWVQDGWALGGINYKNEGGHWWIARKVSGRWKIGRQMQDYLPMSDIKELRIPRKVADRLKANRVFRDK